MSVAMIDETAARHNVRVQEAHQGANDTPERGSDRHRRDEQACRHPQAERKHRENESRKGREAQVQQVGPLSRFAASYRADTHGKCQLLARCA